MNMNRFFLFAALFWAVAPPLSAQINWTFDNSDRTFCLNTGSCNVGDVNITATAEGGCTILDYLYKIDLNNDGINDVNGSGNHLNSPLPKGVHKITWRANDGCANILTCTQKVTVRDCLPPNLICINGLTQALDGPGCEVSFNANFFILNLSDNCTPTNQIQIGIRKEGTGTGFPTGTSVTFDECNIGLNTLELQVRDGNNLTNTCLVYVLVQAGTSNCNCDPDGDLTLRGCARTPDGRRAGSITLKSSVESTGNVTTPYSKNRTEVKPDSCFQTLYNKMPFGGNYRVRASASRNDDPLNGVSTFDLLLISKHILGADTFQTIYKTLAADVNNSKSVTSFDILEIRKLILGLYDTLPNVPSWRFVRPATNPTNTAAFAQVKFEHDFNLPNLARDTTITGLDFIAIKSGDVNFNAAGSLFNQSDDRRSLLLRADDRHLRAGETLSLPILLSENTDLAGWQFALGFDPATLQIEAIEPGDAPGFDADNFALSPSGQLRAIAFDGTGKGWQLNSGGALFHLKIKALRDTDLGEAIWLDEKTLAPEAYPSRENQPTKLAFQLSAPSNTTGNSVQFFAPRPNPFREKATFGLLLDADAETEIVLFDLTGRAVFSQVFPAQKGYQTLDLPVENLPGAGVYFFRATVGGQVFSGKLQRADW